MLVYLASPYSHPDKAVIKQRMEVLLKIDAMLSNDGMHVISPLYKHYTAEQESLPTDWEYWQKYCLLLLSKCDKMVVICYPGVASIGVAGELEYCKEHGIPVEYVDGA
jgi:hypothetical protein